MTSAVLSENNGAVTDVGPASDHRVRRPYLTAVPDCEPPFDDERPAVGRLQALRRPTPPSPRAGPPSLTGRLRAGPRTVADAAVPGWSQDADMGVRRTASSELPVAARSGPVLARALVEVLCGQRPLPQLRVHCAPDVFAGLQARSVAPGPLGHLLNVRVCEPADGVAEVSVVFRRAERVKALAFRIQGVDGRWRVTALQTG